MIRRLLPHARQLTLYGLSGGTSAAVEIGSYLVFLEFGMQYLVASVTSFILSFLTAFFLHKYVVFRKPKAFLKHLHRHALAEGFNVVAGTLLLYALVESGLASEQLGKLVAMGLGVLWNFLIFKFLVFV